MQRARRLALVAVLPLLGVLALAGCRSEPGVAAYVGGTKYTVEQVDALAAEGRDKISRDYGVVRQTVLSWLLIRDVGQVAAKERGLTLQPADAADVVAQNGLRPNSPLAQLYVDEQAVINALKKSATVVEPTEADQREVYSHLSVGGRQLPPFDEVRQYLTKESIGAELGLRTTLSDLLAAAKVQVNPLYTPLLYPIPVQIGQVPGFILAPLSGVTTSPVTGASGSA